MGLFGIGKKKEESQPGLSDEVKSMHRRRAYDIANDEGEEGGFHNAGIYLEDLGVLHNDVGLLHNAMDHYKNADDGSPESLDCRIRLAGEIGDNESVHQLHCMKATRMANAGDGIGAAKYLESLGYLKEAFAQYKDAGSVKDMIRVQTILEGE